MPSIQSGRALPPPSHLADLGSLLARLSDSPASAKPAAKKTERSAPDEPSRDWVQISRSRDDAGLASELRRIKAKAPRLFAGRSVWTADEGRTNRLLVGPFESDMEAREFVSELRKKGVGAFRWTSASGQEIKKLPAR